MYLIYDTVTGAICGQSTSEPMDFAGYAHVAVPIPPDLAASYVTAAGEVKARVAIDWAAIPTDALISTNGAAPVSRFTLPTALGVWKLAAVGKYRGEQTVTNLSVSELEAQLLAALKDDAENRKMAFLTSGGAKKAEYAAKRAEVAFWDSLGGTVTAALSALGALTPAMKSAKFAYATADAAAFGDTISAAIERFRAGATRCAKVPEIAAAEAKAAAAIRAATTAKAKRAAAVVTWPVT